MTFKRLRTAALLLPVVCAAQKTCAQMIYDPFDYGSAAAGTNLANLTGTSPSFTGYTNPMNGIPWWDANTTVSGTGGNELILANPANNLSKSGLPNSTGSLIQYNVASSPSGASAAASRTARLNLSNGPVTGGTIYYSMLFRVTDPTNLNSAGGSFFAAFNEEPNTFNPGGNPGNDPGRLQFRLGVNAGSIQVGVKCNTNAAAFYDTDHEFATGATADTIFAVVGVTFNGGGSSDDVSSVWINPSSSTFGQAAAPSAGTLSESGGTDVPAIMSMILRQGNALIAKGVEVDDVRVDRSWSQVTAPTGTTWAGAPGAAWSIGTNWGGSAPNGAAQFVTFYSGAAGNVNVDSPQTVGTINIKNTNSYNITGAQITMDAGGAAGMSAINVYAPMDPTGPGVALASSHTISAPLQLNNQFETNVGVSQTLNLNGAISGSGTFLKNGAGVTVLGGNNTFTGEIDLNGGALAVSSDANLGNASNQVFLNGGTLRAGAANTVLNRNVTVLSTTIGTAGTFGQGTFDTAGNNMTITGSLTGTSVSSLAAPVSGTQSASIINKVGAGVLTVPNVVMNGLNVQGGTLKIATNGTDSGTSSVKTATIAGATDAWTAALDLNNNSAIVDYSTTSPLPTIVNQLKSGYANGAWTGNGINSSAAAAAASTSTKTAIGYTEASVQFGSFPATFHGQNVPDNTAVLLQYTLAGDGDLSGTVDLTDFTFLAANFNGTSKGWREGDYNYDGTVDLTDFSFLASNFNKTLSAPAGGLGAAVPEPGVMGLLAAVALLGCRRRRLL
jgi:autotransporter-associated beta strand protein